MIAIDGGTSRCIRDCRKGLNAFSTPRSSSFSSPSCWKRSPDHPSLRIFRTALRNTGFPALVGNDSAELAGRMSVPFHQEPLQILDAFTDGASRVDRNNRQKTRSSRFRSFDAFNGSVRRRRDGVSSCAYVDQGAAAITWHQVHHESFLRLQRQLPERLRQRRTSAAPKTRAPVRNRLREIPRAEQSSSLAPIALPIRRC